MTEVVIVDYGMGNRRSVEKALEHVGARPVLSSDPAVIRGADRLVLPGVGAFPRAMQSLRELGLVDALRDRAASGARLLGICLGMQLLFSRSTELGGDEGLGLLEGEVTALEAPRVPHIGWNLVTPTNGARLLDGPAAYYHVHSFACRPSATSDVSGTASYGESFASVVERGNVAGVQFHPEKSSTDGLALLKRWLSAPGSEPLGERSLNPMCERSEQ